MSGELQSFFRQLADRLSTDIAQEWERAVEQELVEPIRQAAPEGQTDHLKRSVRKVQGSLNGAGKLILANATGEFSGITQWVVMAGGEMTTKRIDHPHGAQSSYDYAIGTEYGTHHEPAHPFFWPTIRSRWRRLIGRAEQILSTKIAKQ